MPITHASWDGGAISEHPLFVAIGGQKTIKTRCNKRVSMAHIDNHGTQCAACLNEIRREARAFEQIKQYSEILEAQGLDAANALAATWEVL